MTNEDRIKELDRLLLEKYEVESHYAAAKLLTSILEPWLDDGAEIDKKAAEVEVINETSTA